MCLVIYGRIMQMINTLAYFHNLYAYFFKLNPVIHVQVININDLSLLSVMCEIWGRYRSFDS